MTLNFLKFIETKLNSLNGKTGKSGVDKRGTILKYFSEK